MRALSESNVEIKKFGTCGRGVFSTCPIRKNKTVLYYGVECTWNQRFTKRDQKCGMSLYSRSGKKHYRAFGRLTKRCKELPKRRNIPFLGYLLNEAPTPKAANAFILMKCCDKLEQGKLIVYPIKTIRHIRAGEQILLDYGRAYKRDYNRMVPIVHE